MWVGRAIRCSPFFVWHVFSDASGKTCKDMGKQDTFNKVLSLIEEETETDRALILSGNKREEVVDARALLLYMLHEIGFYPSQIAALSGICPRCVMPFIQSFEDRMDARRMLRIYYERVKRKLGESTD